MTSPEAMNDPFAIDKLMGKEGQKLFSAKVAELKAEGYTGVRVEKCTISRNEDPSETLKKFQLNPGEEIVAHHLDTDSMAGAGDSERSADIVYALIAKKA